MLDDYSVIQSLFRELDEHISRRTSVYMIGGGSLMRYGLKSQTKDIDIVVDTPSEFG